VSRETLAGYEAEIDSPNEDAESNSDDSIHENNEDPEKPNDHSEEETTRFSSVYILKANELFPTESNANDGTDASKPLSESLSGEHLIEYTDEIIPTLLRGESYETEVPGFFSTEEE
jgi:hypothetical protein